LALVALVHLVDAAEEAGIDEGSLLDGTAHRTLLTSSIPATNDHLAGRLVLAGAQPHGGLAPGRLGWHAGRGLALTTAVRMVAGVHHHAADLGAPPHVAAASGLADVLVLVIQVAHLADRGHAGGVHPPHLAGREPDGGHLALLGEQLRAAPGAAHDLSTAAGDHLHVVDLGAERHPS